MDAAQSDGGRPRGSMARSGSIPRKTSTGRSFRQTTNGIAQFLKSTPREQAEVDSEDDEFDEDHYFQTLVTRGAARGVLTVHLKDCKDFKSLSVKKGTQSFVRVSVGGKVKCTRLQPYKDHKASDNKVAIVFNEWKYFSIRIPKEEGRTLDPVHRIVVLELIFFEQDSGIPKLIGKTFVKLHDMINKERVAMHVDLKLSRQVVCKLDLEMVITYGAFGYGYSHQLQHPKRSMDSFVDRSLFLRCPPPEHRTDQRYNVLTPRSMPYIDIIESLMRQESADPDAPDSHHFFPPPVMNQLQRRGRLLQLHETFQSRQSQADVIQDLEKMIIKRGLQTSGSWRQNKKSKKILNRWKNKASLIPKLLGFAQAEAKKSGPGQEAEGEEAPLGPRARSPLLAAVLRANRIAETEGRQPADDPPAPRWSMGRLMGTGGTAEPAEDVSAAPSAPSAPGWLNLPWSSSPAQPAASSSSAPAPPPHARAAGPSSGATEDDPTEMWLRAPASIPSLSSVLSDKDLEPIRSSLAFSPPPLSSSASFAAADLSPQEAASGWRRHKPGRDKLKTMEGSSTPYRR
ncbi:cation channel sperm-associated targeting subunit tau-like [Sardina pilchardus]|uniref:cation channel sperm-associated targeting subunit tau-like n=1 Tax=Sardina pilchardus TaxID=27697 RepID=UPI002E0D4CB6